MEFYYWLPFVLTPEQFLIAQVRYGMNDDRHRGDFYQ